MIQRVLFVSVIILMVSVVGSKLLTNSIEEDDRYELIKVAEFKISNSESFDIEGNNLLLLSDDIPDYTDKVVVFQPRVWYEKATEDNQYMTKIEMKDNQLLLSNRQNITIINFSVNDAFFYNNWSGFYFFSIRVPLRRVQYEDGIHIGSEMYNKYRYSTRMPYIVYY